MAYAGSEDQPLREALCRDVRQCLLKILEAAVVEELRDLEVVRLLPFVFEGDQRGAGLHCVGDPECELGAGEGHLVRILRGRACRAEERETGNQQEGRAEREASA